MQLTIHGTNAREGGLVVFTQTVHIGNQRAAPGMFGRLVRSSSPRGGWAVAVEGQTYVYPAAESAVLALSKPAEKLFLQAVETLPKDQWLAAAVLLERAHERRDHMGRAHAFLIDERAAADLLAEAGLCEIAGRKYKTAAFLTL